MTSSTLNDTAIETTARAYIEAVGRRDLTPLQDLLDERLTAAFAGSTSTKEQWVQALDRLLPALVRNDIREVYVAGSRACVVYDFVTDPPAGAVRCVELLTVEDGRITDIELLLDRVQFAPVRQALEERAAQR